MLAEDTNTRAWQVYGQRPLARGYAPPVPDRLGWTPWDGVGPGAEALGDVTGRRVLDIGSGAYHHRPGARGDGAGPGRTVAEVALGGAAGGTGADPLSPWGPGDNPRARPPLP